MGELWKIMNMGELWDLLEGGEPGGTRLGEPLRVSDVASPLVTAYKAFKACIVRE